jgi:predicted nucleic acid-binding protein
MLVVIADTSPIRYLIQVGHIDVLHHLFSAVSIPTEVALELADPSAPATVRAWMDSPPTWLKVLEAGTSDDPAFSDLDSRERAAIALGIALNADLILIDERRGYAAARRMGLEATGTLGILDLAARRNLINLPDALERLKQTNFRYRKDILDKLLASYRD